MTTPKSSADVESAPPLRAGESETLAESPATQPRADSEAEPELDAPTEVGETEMPAESATTQPAVDAEPDTAAAAAPTAGSAGAEPAVEAAVEDAMPEEPPTTRQRAARAPAWAWVAITLMALLVMSGLITLAVARNANPSTPESVEDAQTLITELEALNGYLATTNQLMSNAIASAEQLSAAAQAKLAGLSEKLADAEPARRTGARASWRPALRDDALRARQGSAAASVSAADSRAADRAARRATARDDQRGCRRPRRQGRRRYGQSRER